MLTPNQRATLYLKLLRYYQYHPLNQRDSHIFNYERAIAGLLQMDDVSRKEVYIHNTRYCAGCNSHTLIEYQHCRIDKFVVYYCGACNSLEPIKFSGWNRPSTQTYYPDGYYNPMIPVQQILPVSTLVELDKLI